MKTRLTIGGVALAVCTTRVGQAQEMETYQYDGAGRPASVCYASSPNQGTAAQSKPTVILHFRQTSVSYSRFELICA
jgi:hypothetical protein